MSVKGEQQALEVSIHVKCDLENAALASILYLTFEGNRKHAFASQSIACQQLFSVDGKTH